MRLDEFLVAYEKAERLSQMQIPLTLEDYNRRLTYARMLGERAAVFSPSEIRAIAYNEDELPITQEKYELRIMGAYSRGNVDFCAKKENRVKEMLLEAVREGITEYSRLIADIEKEMASLKA